MLKLTKRCLVRSDLAASAGAAGKTIVLGMVERGGDIITRIVKNVKRATLEPIIARHLWGGTTVSTDELASYQHLRKHGFKHRQVNGVHHTNTIEGFWRHFKRSIADTHTHVSRRYLVKYLREFEFRWNMRHDPAGMFPYLLKCL
jgi:transposase